MTTETQIVEFEIVPDNLGLELAAKNSLEIAFRGFFEEAEKWKRQAESITDPKLARTARLELKNLRVSAEKKRKELKEDSLRMGKAIDGANNILLAHIVPIERHLEDIEKEEERRIQREIQEKAEARRDLITPYLDPSLPPPVLTMMTDEQFDQVLIDAKMLHEAKIERAKKEQAERIAKEKLEAEAREAQRLENIRLKAEAESREKEIAKEREKAAAAEAKAKSERDAIEEAARKERLQLQAIAETERVKAENAAASAKALHDANIKRLADEKSAAESKAKAEKEAAKKAAAAPDKLKIDGFASAVRALEVPPMKSEAGQVVADEISAKVASFAKWIESQALTL